MTIRFISLKLIAAYLLLLCQVAYAGSLNQSGMHLIFKDAEHSVYFSPKWVDGLGGVTVLLDYTALANHSGFEGNEPYLSNEVRYLVDCENKRIAFKSDATYQGHKASGKQLNWHERTVGPDHNSLEWYEFAEMDKETQPIFKHACQR